MSIRTSAGSAKLGEKIKNRRNELGLTIEEAAEKSGVGTKTWSRYEAGGSIRSDKVSGICKVLKWNTLPDSDSNEDTFDINEYEKRESWPDDLAKTYGLGAAVSFVIGSDILYDNIRQDLDALAKRHKGTHIGELPLSYLVDCMPEQFLMNYDYDFLYCMKSTLLKYCKIAKYGGSFTAHTVLDEIILYNIMNESEFLMENSIIPNLPPEQDEEFYGWDSWAFDLFDDMDVVTFLYSDHYLTEDNPYHFSHWLQPQFYCD